MLVRAVRGVELKLMCLLVSGMWSSTFIPTCFHVLRARVAALLSFRTAPVDLVLSRAFISDIAGRKISAVFFSPTKGMCEGLGG